MEGGPDGGPVALEVAPGQQAAGGVGGDRGEDGVDILTPHLAGVQAHRQVPAQGSEVNRAVPEKAPTRAFSLLKAPTSAFTFKNLSKDTMLNGC